MPDYILVTHFYLLKGEERPVCIPCDQLCPRASAHRVCTVINDRMEKAIF